MTTSENKRKRMDDPDDSSHCTTRTSPHLGDRARSRSDHRETSSINPLIIPNNATFASGTGIMPPAGPLPTEERRDPSRLSSEVAQDAETQARDDKKLKAYTELSSTLAKVSSTAAAAVMPTLADILLRHAQGKQRAEDNLNALSGVWNQAFELFATEISHVVDAELEGALKKIREQAGLMHKSVLLRTSTPMPTLQRTDVFSSELSATNCFKDDSRTHLTHAKENDTERKRDSKREQKRRRFSSVSPTPEAKVPQSAVKLEAGVQEILNQMKTKIDTQAQSLQELAKENNELPMSDTPNTLKHPNPPAPPSSAPEDSEADDNDAFNTAGARIHFGPLRSPEKKFGPMMARHSTLHPGNLGSPVQCYPRLSTPQPRSPSPEPMQQLLREQDTIWNQVQQNMEVTDVSLSGRETPDNEEALQDEVSSALAIKISRAHDNPSPPPIPPTALPLIDLASPSPGLPFLAFGASQLAALVDVNQSEGSTPPSSSNVSPGLSRDRSPTPLTTPNATQRGSQPDLISFESFSTPAAVFRVISPQASTSKLQSSSDNPSVDDLFLQTPSLRSSERGGSSPQVAPMVVVESTETENWKGKGKATIKAVEENKEDEPVLDSSLFPASEGSYGGSSRSSSPMTLDVTGEDVRTPTQRSTRPRRSGTPYRAADSREDHDMSDATQYSEAEEKLGENTQLLSDQESGKEDGSTRDEKKAAGTVRSIQMNSTPNSLVASPSRQRLPFSLTIPESAPTNSKPEDLPRRPFAIFPQLQLPQTPQRSTSPIRFASPSRSTAQKSAAARLQLMTMDDPNRTPARRILMAEAVAQGYVVSPLKGSRPAVGHRPGLDVPQTPYLSIPLTDSPARRIAISDATLPAAQKKQGIRFGSPFRGVSKERSGSIEPPLTAPGSKARDKGSSTPPSPPATDSSTLSRTGPSTAASTSRSDSLPFPLVSSRKEHPASIPEEIKKEGDVTMASPTKPGRVLSSPAKSSLKQATSRIPRTVKPYARPAPKASNKGKTAIMRAVKSNTEISKTTATIHKALPEIGSSSDDFKHEEPVATVRKRAPTTSTLERRRVVPEKLSPLKTRPVVVLRQVPRVAGPNIASTSKQAPLPSIAFQAKKPPQQIRRVIDRPPESQPILQAHPSQRSEPSTSTEPSQPAQAGPADEVIDIEAIGHDGTETNRPETVLAEKALPSSPNPEGDIAAPQPNIPEGVRRTTRVRKAINPTTVADVFGSSEARPPRRKATAQTSVRPVTTFMGMSATALKALTTSNTVRNQRYLAAKLETEVIRKEGARPESPAVKIRTISQRQQDEKGKQRKERAQRRARRSEDGTGYQSDEMDGRGDGHSDSGADSDEENSSPAPQRHKRGPGDEDDYQTPVRKLKRLKLGVDIGDDSREKERRVKWDRGLFTTIYLDEVKLGTRRLSKENIATKGCLAPTAKALPLDNLGNLPDSPLAELVEESVVVKKFVYDNDVEPVPEVIVVKNTRLRNKKGKS
ncbi:hypothetical protein D9615_003934 [Tricholomella constricta]|uniref:Uncharacterized protein n=1 Tax=Tricholomella constricta TaxID=117010 RepID=A0A8H5M517_9AGAR|nr:hypothetical protein D9615_003934 [Tricholomella constricta]